MSIPDRPPMGRRRFLEIGTAASLTAALPLARAAEGPVAAAPLRAPGPITLQPLAVIYDERFEAARRFAECMRSLPLPAHPIRGDVTQLWYSQLYPLWKRAPTPIAGLTAYAAMFCLERLAWDQRLRMVRCLAGPAREGSSGGPVEHAAMIARGLRASCFASPERGAAATGTLAAEASGPLHFWLIASPAQFAALHA